MPGRLVVENSRELNQAFKTADANTRKQFRNSQKDMAEPVRATAVRLAQGGIRNIGPRWAEMRTGVTQTLVYVAPKSRRKSGSPRPNLAGLLAGQALEPALDQHSVEIERRFGQLMDKVASEFNSGRLVL